MLSDSLADERGCCHVQTFSCSGTRRCLFEAGSPSHLGLEAHDVGRLQPELAREPLELLGRHPLPAALARHVALQAPAQRGGEKRVLSSKGALQPAARP